MSDGSRHGPVQANRPVLDKATSLDPLPHPVFKVSGKKERRSKRSSGASPLLTAEAPLRTYVGSPKKRTVAPSGDALILLSGGQNWSPTGTARPPFRGTLKNPLPEQLTKDLKPVP